MGDVDADEIVREGADEGRDTGEDGADGADEADEDELPTAARMA